MGRRGSLGKRLSNLSGGDLDAILANDNTAEQAYVEILPTDGAFHTADETTPVRRTPCLWG